jgi:sporulation protein YunB
MRRFRRYQLPALWRWMVLMLACGYLAVRLIDLILLGPLAALAENEARLRGIDAVNRIILGSVEQSLKHEDLITYEKDQQGRIAAYRVNTQIVSQVAADAAGAVRREFGQLAAAPFRVPIGALTGSHILASRGPRVPVRLMPIGSVAIDIHQEFSSEGINQTRHRVWLSADAQVQVILPMVSKAVQVAVAVPITETVIVGPVPEGFFGGNASGFTLPVRP